MAPDQEPPARGEQEQAKQPEQPADTAVLEAAEKPDAVKAALDRERAAAKAAEERARKAEDQVKRFEDRDRTAEEKAQAEATEARTQAEQANRELLRLRIAVRKGLPAELVGRLQGDTERELEKDADELLKLVGEQAASADLAPGARQTSEPSDMDARIRRAAGRA